MVREIENGEGGGGGGGKKSGKGGRIFFLNFVDQNFWKKNRNCGGIFFC